MNAVLIGFGLGFFVALQLGPMSLLLIRSTLRSGWKAGVAIGSLTWVTVLTSGVALAGRSMSTRAVRVTDGVAGAGLIGFDGVLAYTTLVAPAGIEPAHKV